MAAAMGAAGLKKSELYDAESVANTWESLFQDLMRAREAAGPGASRRSRLMMSSRARLRERRVNPPLTGLMPELTDVTAESAGAVAPKPVVAHGEAEVVGNVTVLRNEHMLPPEAVDRNFEVCLGIVRQAGAPYFVIPPPRGWAPTVVLSSSLRSAFLAALAQVPDAQATYVQPVDSRGRAGKVGAVAEMAPRLRLSRPPAVRVYVAWTDAGRSLSYRAGYACEVQFWDEVDGDLVASRPNEFVESFPLHDLTKLVQTHIRGVVVPTLPLMTRKTFDEVDFPIDAVYTWVDGDDPDWMATRRQRAGLTTSAAHHVESDSDARYRSRRSFAIRCVRWSTLPRGCGASTL